MSGSDSVMCSQVLCFEVLSAQGVGMCIERDMEELFCNLFLIGIPVHSNYHGAFCKKKKEILHILY